MGGRGQLLLPARDSECVRSLVSVAEHEGVCQPDCVLLVSGQGRSQGGCQLVCFSGEKRAVNLCFGGAHLQLYLLHVLAREKLDAGPAPDKILFFLQDHLFLKDKIKAKSIGHFNMVRKRRKRYG